MEKHREVAVETGRQLPILAERRGGKAAGELSERVSVSGADSMVLRDDGIRGLQGSAQAEQQSRVTTGQEARASPHGQRASQDASAVSSDYGYRRRESFEGQEHIAGISQLLNGAANRTSVFDGAGETTMNPRIVSRCNSADRIDEE